MYDERELLSNQEGCLPNDMLEVSITSIAYNIEYDTCSNFSYFIHSRLRIIVF